MSVDVLRHARPTGQKIRMQDGRKAYIPILGDRRLCRGGAFKSKKDATIYATLVWFRYYRLRDQTGAALDGVRRGLWHLCVRLGWVKRPVWTKGTHELLQTDGGPVQDGAELHPAARNFFWPFGQKGQTVGHEDVPGPANTELRPEAGEEEVQGRPAEKSAVA